MQQRLRILRPATLRDELDAAARALPPPALGTGDRINAEGPDLVTGATAPGVADDLAVVDAHLACGDFTAVLGLVRTAGTHPILPLVLARYVRWSGDLQTAEAAWDSVMTIVDTIAPDPGAATRNPRSATSFGGATAAGAARGDRGQGIGTAEPGLAHATALELAPLATDLGHAEVAARLHRIARTADGRTLPETTDSSASTIRRITSETLGIDPDAVRGRLRLRPRLDQLAELEIHDIRFGDASVRLVAAVRPGMIEIVIEQEAGGIPVTVLLEPYVTPGLANPSPATVDGQPATLTPQAADYGTIIPVQLVLDDVRTVVLGGDSGG